MTDDHDSAMIDVPLSRKILTWSSAAFITGLYMVRKQRRTQYVKVAASDRALATRALLLGTFLAGSGVALLTGFIGTLTGSNSFPQFRQFMERNLKTRHPEPDEHEEEFGF